MVNVVCSVLSLITIFIHFFLRYDDSAQVMGISGSDSEDDILTVRKAVKMDRKLKKKEAKAAKRKSKPVTVAESDIEEGDEDDLDEEEIGRQE
jgi:hypothetical protein